MRNARNTGPIAILVALAAWGAFQGRALAQTETVITVVEAGPPGGEGQVPGAEGSPPEAGVPAETIAPQEPPQPPSPEVAEPGTADVKADEPAVTEGEKKILGQLEKFTKSEKLTLEGTAYVRYWYDIQDAAVEEAGGEEAHRNSFELWRFYFGIKSKLTKWLSIRFTADVGPEGKKTTSEAGEHVHGDPPTTEPGGAHVHEVEGETSYQLFVKYAWLNVEPVTGLNLRAGVIENPINDHIDSFWGYRFVAKNLGDEKKVWNSADVGGYIKYVFPRNFGNITVGVVNGAGYKNALDVNRDKDLWAHVMLTPFAPWVKVLEKLTIGLQVEIPMVMKDELDKEVVIVPFIGWSHPWVTIAYHPVIRMTRVAETDERIWAMGHGVYFRFDTPWNVGLLGDFYVWDEDKDLDAERTAFSALAGVSYSPAELFSIAATCFVGWQTDDGDAATEEPEKEIRLLLSSQFKF
jgi:hypothetical protein